MSTNIPSNPSQRAQLYGNVSRPGSSSPPRRSTPPESPARSESPDAGSTVSRPDLGEGLSAEEREMIHDTFPPSPETSMRIYGRDRGQQDLQPESLGNQLDIRG